MQANPMNTATQYSIGALLEMNGARIRGRGRADCPDCKRFRSVSFKEIAFCCHGLGCEFRGGIGALKKRLGIRREWLSPKEYRELCRKREQVDEAARRLAAAVHAQRMELVELLQDLDRLEALAHDAGASESRWESLALVYSQLARILAELAILESASAADLARFLCAGPEMRGRIIDGVIVRGGLCDSDGKFREVAGL
jgi:hypothetical protein